MHKCLPGLLLALFAVAPAWDVMAAQSGDANTGTSLAALTARIEALEANSEQLRKQAAEALAAAKDARAQLEALKADQADSQVAAVSAPGGAAPQGSGIGTGNAFNPAISVILNGFYTHHSNEDNANLRPGFPIVGEGGPLPNGFSLGESELSLAANIDDKFYGQLTVTAGTEDGKDHLGVEEAYIDTTALPYGLGVRAGRFYSNIGYLNSHHTHTDFFSERPLVYQSFLGNQYGDDGVQLQWVAPTDIFLQVGTEAFRGTKYPTAGAANGGLGAHTVYVHAGGDVGASNAWFAGLSMLDADTRGAEDGFSGNNRVYIADGTWKWSSHGNFNEGGLLLRGEYLIDQRHGIYQPSFAEPVDFSLAGQGGEQPWTGSRKGFYAEAVYRFNRSWDAGYRYGRLWGADRAGPYASSFDPTSNSLELTWHNSEFSLLRLQASHNEPADNSVTVQYQAALGAHGAHKF